MVACLRALAAFLALAITAPQPASAQEFARRLAQAGAGPDWYGPVLRFDEIGGAAMRDALLSMFAGPFTAPELRFSTVLYCAPTPGEGGAQCDQAVSGLVTFMRTLVQRLPKQMARVIDNMSYEASPDGLPVPVGGVDPGARGFRFVFTRYAESDVAAGDPRRNPSPGERRSPTPTPPATMAAADPTIWTKENAAPLTEALRTRLHPIYEPLTFDLIEPNRREAEALAFDFWMSTDFVNPSDVAPAIFSVSGASGPLFAAHVMADGTGIAVSDGSGEEVYRVIAGIEPRRRHRISIRSRIGETEVYVDGAFAGRLDVGMIPGGPVRRVTLGALPDGDARFDGYVGRFTMWTSFLDAKFTSMILPRGGGGEGGADAPFAPTLLAVSTDPTAESFTLVEAPVANRPRPGWWRQAGVNETRLTNIDDFVAGRTAPSFSALNDAIMAERAGRRTVSPAARRLQAQLKGRDLEGGHSLFSTHPLYRFAFDEGLSTARYDLRDAAGDVVASHIPPYPVGRVSGVSMNRDERYLSVIGLILCGTEDQRPANRSEWRPYYPIRGADDPSRAGQAGIRASCEDPTLREDVGLIWFDEDEEIRGFTHQFLKDGRITNLTLHTNRRSYGPYAAGARRQAEITRLNETRSVWVDPGAPFYAIAAAGDKGFTALGFHPAPFISDPGVTVFGENGEALRYHEVSPGFYRGYENVAQTLAPFGNPTIEVVGEDYVLMSGVDPTEDWVYRTKRIAFERIADRARVTPKENYNDTFVALSKAVNLQANYFGYDIIQMDPIHLTRAGATLPIFRQPGGETKDYYDFNRIFVPRGLTFVPEFTGDMHKEVHDTSTYAEFKAAVSKSVSIGFTSKALPSFSMSSTMREARETISEQRHSRTIGFSRAYFYDLVLEKSEIDLHPDFVTAVARLADRGDYQGFIETFGTHYAAAVIYGGVGVLEIDMDETTRATLLERGVETKTEANLMLDAKTETGFKFGTDDESENSRQFRAAVTNENQNFYWVGGTHVGLSNESWSVGTDGVVPVHVALRPIDEILSPAIFADPEIHIRVRQELRAAVDDYIAFHGGLEPTGPPDVPPGVVEFRIDRITCGYAPQPEYSQWGRWDYKTGEWSDLTAGDGRNLEPFAATVYPVIDVIAFDARGRELRDKGALGAPPAEGDEPGTGADEDKTINVLCNTNDDILARSPLLQSHAMSRFSIGPNHIRANAIINLADFRDEEYNAMHKRVSDNITTEDALEEGALVGATLGLKLLWDKYVTGKGSKTLDLIDKVKHPERKNQIPEARGHNIEIWRLLCEPLETEAECRPRLDSDVRARAGRWVKGTYPLSPPEKNCEHCVTYELHYSVRYLE